MKISCGSAGESSPIRSSHRLDTPTLNSAPLFNASPQGSDGACQDAAVGVVRQDFPPVLADEVAQLGKVIREVAGRGVRAGVPVVALVVLGHPRVVPRLARPASSGHRGPVQERRATACSPFSLYRNRESEGRGPNPFGSSTGCRSVSTPATQRRSIRCVQRMSIDSCTGSSQSDATSMCSLWMNVE